LDEWKVLESVGISKNSSFEKDMSGKGIEAFLFERRKRMLEYTELEI
jgi:hypothetical protein